MQRVVIDTNVFVSGIFYGGTPRGVLDCITDGTITPCFTATTFEELERVLADEKFTDERSELKFDVRTCADRLISVSLVFH